MLEDLTFEQREKLTKALIAAFPNMPDLELMVKRQLNERLNLITQGEPNYVITVDKLLEWAEAKGKIQELVDGARKENPDNLRLKKLVESWQLEALLYEEYEEPKKEKINRIYYQVVNRFFRHRSITKELDCLGTLITNLFQANSNYSEYNAMHYFVELLLNDELWEELSLESQNGLKEWRCKFVENPQNLEEKIKQKQNEISKDDLKKKPCLLIRICKNKTGNRYQARAWFVEDQKNYDSCKAKQVSLSGKISKFGDKKEDIERFFRLCRKNCIEQYKPGDVFVIHIFLPKELLNLDINCWPLEEKDEIEFFGNTDEIILRADERLDEKYMNEFSQRWRNKWNDIKDKFPQLAKDIFKKIEAGENTNFPAMLSEIYNIGAREDVLGVNLPQPLSTLENKNLDELFHKLIIRCAIPLAIWIRQPAGEGDCSDQIIKILDSPLEKLPEKIREKRREKGDNIAKQLSLLWDDPNMPHPEYNQKFTKGFPD